MSGKATLVVTATPKPDEADSVKHYLQAVLPLLLGAGGTLVKRLKVTDLIHGNPSGMILVMDFASNDEIKKVFDSEEYAALIPVRDKGFAEINILVAYEM
jgi:uncharacterized protein (DUF1330 family)